MVKLCKHCIEAIRSRGETVYVGNQLPFWSGAVDPDERYGTCEWCEEETDELWECEF